jgi:Heterokaryon incompatibility protein (HET)
MRLLDTDTAAIRWFSPNQIPDYAILSHTWRPNAEEEIVFQDMNKSLEELQQKPSYRKLRGFLNTAAEHGFKWAWLDTCCIDKSSSTDLSEAINSMYRYYQRAGICFAYLEDIPSGEMAHQNFTASRWWTRGWTLQELIAPKEVIFYSSDWLPIAAKAKLALSISKATGIDERVLKNSDTLRTVSVAKRMSWAAKRETTREEDMAYCLLGIFDVNMPLLYGEGLKSFLRLQEEIMKESSDQSLFAWSQPLDVSASNSGVLAPHPRYFLDSAGVVPFDGSEHFDTGTEPYRLTNKGLHIRLPIIKTRSSDLNCVALLACHREGDFEGVLGITLVSAPGSRDNVFMRDSSISPEVVHLFRDDEGFHQKGTYYLFDRHSSQRTQANIRSIYILKNASSDGTSARYVWLRKFPLYSVPDFEINNSVTQRLRHWHSWDRKTRTTMLHVDPLVPFTERTAVVILRRIETFQPHFGILIEVDSVDKYSVNIQILVASDDGGCLISSLHDLAEAKKFENYERIATAKDELGNTITVVPSWERIMNSEVLVIDISNPTQKSPVRQAISMYHSILPTALAYFYYVQISSVKVIFPNLHMPVESIYILFLTASFFFKYLKRKNVMVEEWTTTLWRVCLSFVIFSISLVIFSTSLLTFRHIIVVTKMYHLFWVPLLWYVGVLYFALDHLIDLVPKLVTLFRVTGDMGELALDLGYRLLIMLIVVLVVLQVIMYMSSL